MSRAVPHSMLVAAYDRAGMVPISQVRMLRRAELAQCHTRSPLREAFPTALVRTESPHECLPLTLVT